MGGESAYLLYLDVYQKFLEDARTYLNDLPSKKTTLSAEMDECIAAVIETDPQAALASVWNNYLGAYLNATIERADINISAADFLLEQFVLADEAYTEAVKSSVHEAEEAANEYYEKVDPVAEGSNDFDKDFVDVPDQEKKGEK